MLGDLSSNYRTHMVEREKQFFQVAFLPLHMSTHNRGTHIGAHAQVNIHAHTEART